MEEHKCNYEGKAQAANLRRGRAKEDLLEIILDLERDGLIRDSGMRRNGKIVWVAVPPDDYTGKPWPRFENGEP